MKDEVTKGYVCTGVFATPEEIERIMTERALPMARVFGRWPEPEKVTHRAALSHGLPEIVGFYGIDFRDGEFIRVRDGDMDKGEPSSEWPTPSPGAA